MKLLARAAPDGLMLSGLGAALAGLYLLLGLAWVLLVGGVAAAAIGLMLDMGWFSGER